jgi:hypothetical protein
MLLALMFMRLRLYRLCVSFAGGLRGGSMQGIYASLVIERLKHNTFSLFIKHAGPEAIGKLFLNFLFQAFKMGIMDSSETVMVGVDSTFMKAYSRRGRKGGISDRGARVVGLMDVATSLDGEATHSYQ